ncbi:LuxR C-terminal-related transcriptional regulator [Serratia fonticola]|uniref:LuxR C-terminal-related transcriptional regulator n=1 Tax=Serratia fonticola TaxID=47917 RepID=UPI0021774402|nr:LuxR C-terminal-related transcriptional regulator [Serratia fonticola]CAI1657645.1 transcriptional regulator NarL [Serratia fonticola]CAI1873288.1 transcriptional regulator NarL [Serratia fonticola]CAI1883694.1 transcriptional regulator NarL [Serratia fonticola]
MIYVITEDNYFAAGIMAILTNADIHASHVSINEFNVLDDNVDHNDIILLCAQSRTDSLALTRLAKRTDGKVIFFIDTTLKIKTLNFSYKGVISKKSLKEELIELISIAVRKNRESAVYLSRQEKIVMDLFAQQQDAYHIARRLNLSEKTVGAHKVNALKKLGLHHLNARSVLLYEHVFQTRV